MRTSIIQHKRLRADDIQIKAAGLELQVKELDDRTVSVDVFTNEGAAAWLRLDTEGVTVQAVPDYSVIVNGELLATEQDTAQRTPAPAQPLDDAELLTALTAARVALETTSFALQAYTARWDTSDAKSAYEHAMRALSCVEMEAERRRPRTDEETPF